MTNATSLAPRRALALTPLALCLLSGCASFAGWDMTPPWKRAAKDEARDEYVLRGNGLEREQRTGPHYEQLESAKQMLANGLHNQAESTLHALAGDKKCPESAREEAILLEAECQRLQKRYRNAESTYQTLFKDYPNTQFTERANKGLFEIAQHWLEGTREQMRLYEEQRKGERSFVVPASFVHFSADMPVFDAEGNAVRVLENIRMREINTPLGEQALLYLGTIKFFREDFHEADHYVTELYSRYPNSPHAAKAIKQSVICKQLCTGGTEYDCRTVEESRKLIHTALGAYAEFAKEDDWVQKQLVGINLQQADRDFKVAEFYRRTGHPGSAYFYYEIVRRNYPNTEYSRKSEERIAELERRNGGSMRPDVPNPQDEVGAPRREGPEAPRVLPPSLAPTPTQAP